MTVERAASLFSATFGRPPRVITSAPGRVNLIGEHTDYSGGEVLPFAIGWRTWVAMAPANGATSRVVSATQQGTRTFDIASATPSGSWCDYVHGALREIVALGADTGNVDVAVLGDVPAGAGLSSSAALEVATALAGIICARGSLLASWDHLAAAAHRAETEFVGVACGLMDQTASAYATEGHALRLWCDSGRREHVPFDRDVLVIDTCKPRDLRDSAFNDRFASCQRALAAIRRMDPSIQHLAHASMEMADAAVMDAVDRRRARHVISETARVGAMVEALESGRPLGDLLFASHQSLRDDFECSTPELDWVVDLAMSRRGVDGARLTGAGWGGCAIVVGTPEALAALVDEIGPAFETAWGRTPRVWLTRAEDGADVDYVET
ncbi:MAG: galactokinase [Gemmatimonadaceae bacterium]|nr:galactokinase [Gemmatimonadaceae bacterium]